MQHRSTGGKGQSMTADQWLDEARFKLTLSLPFNGLPSSQITVSSSWHSTSLSYTHQYVKTATRENEVVSSSVWVQSTHTQHILRSKTPNKPLHLTKSKNISSLNTSENYH